MATPRPPKVVSFDDDYYSDLTGQPKLVGRNEEKPPQPRPEILDPRWGQVMVPGPKRVFTIGKCHPLLEKLDNGLKTNILNILRQGPIASSWISVDFLRIGYCETPEENPVVILITVEEKAVTKEDGSKVVNLLEDACRQVGLSDINVEIKEGTRMNFASVNSPPELMPYQSKVPYPGSPVGLEGEDGRVGTLGGYVQVDKDVLACTKELCGAEDIGLVVRPEEQTHQTFGPPSSKEGTLGLNTSESSLSQSLPPDEHN